MGYVLVDLKSKRVIRVGESIVFCMTKNRSVKFRGKLIKIAPNGSLVFNNLYLYKNNKEFERVDCELSTAVYEIRVWNGRNGYNDIVIKFDGAV